MAKFKRSIDKVESWLDSDGCPTIWLANLTSGQVCCVGKIRTASDAGDTSDAIHSSFRLVPPI
jgi:hypothetical protein